MRGWGDAQRLSGDWPLRRVQFNSVLHGLLCSPPSKRVDLQKTKLAPVRPLFCEALGELDQDTPIGRIPDFSEGDDEPQPFDNIQVDFIVAKQLQQFVPGVLGIVDIHRGCSGRR
jgi:hypothetical protein